MNRSKSRKESDAHERSDGFATRLRYAYSVHPTNKAEQMDQSFLAMPLVVLEKFHLSQGAKLEIVTTADGLNRLDVISNGKTVATFTSPALATPLAPPERLCAANEPTLNSAAGRRNQWWDDDLLNEPLEPLAEFE